MKRYPSLVRGAALLMVTTLTAGFPVPTHLTAAAFQREHGQGDLHRDDPCDQLPDPPGQANGIDKICAAGGSSSGIAKGDFNGDGFADLAVGVPGEDTPNDVSNSGAVNVIYGSGGGLTTSTTVVPAVPAPQFWSQNATGVPGISEARDAFGSALAAGDFNDDGYSDLAIGVPGDDVQFADSGAVIVIYGSRNGLTATDPSVPASRFFDLRSATNQSGNMTFAIAGAGLGSSLAWGDFNGDGVGDLAIGASSADVGARPLLLGGTPTLDNEAGLVWVLTGTRDDGLDLEGNELWFQFDVQFDVVLEEDRDSFDEFGEALTSGDFNGDGFFDLAVGAPGEKIDSGRVDILFGSAFGVDPADRWFLTQGFFVAPNLFGQPVRLEVEFDDRFGASLAAGDYNGDGRADLAIGAPGENQSTGFVHVIYGSSGGFLVANTTLRQFAATGGDEEHGDGFGTTLAAGDFNGDGRADLAIGVPFEDVVVNGVSIVDAGEVDVIYGEATGLSLSSGTQVWHQGSTNTKHGEIIGDPGSGDRFGASLTAWNFGRNEFEQLGPGVFVVRRFADLAIGVPYEDVSGVNGAGGVNVIYGRFEGLLPLGNQFWSQGSARVPGGVESSDHFGASVY